MLYARVTAFVVSCVLIPWLGAPAQLRTEVIRLSVDNRDLKQIASTPFGLVEVLDSRFDTDWLYAVQDGDFPPRVIMFDGPASGAIQRYLQELADTIPHGKDTMLLRLRELRVANKNIPFQVKGVPARRAGNLRMGILLVADVYRKKQDRYYPLLSVNKLYPFRGDYQMEKHIAAALNETLAMAGGHWAEDSLAFRYAKDTTGYSLAQINVNVQDTWAAYPVMQSDAPAAGLYMQFADFQNNRPLAESFRLAWNERDSLYHLSVSRKIKRYPWAVADSGALYIHVLADVYVKTWRYHNTRCFYIPQTLPDMYTLLSIDGGAVHGNTGYVNGSSGNLLVDLGVLAVGIGVDAIITGVSERKIKKRGMQSGFRYCYIDMDYGDVIYGETLPDL